MSPYEEGFERTRQWFLAGADPALVPLCPHFSTPDQVYDWLTGSLAACAIQANRLNVSIQETNHKALDMLAQLEEVSSTFRRVDRILGTLRQIVLTVLFSLGAVLVIVLMLFLCCIAAPFSLVGWVIRKYRKVNRSTE